MSEQDNSTRFDDDGEASGLLRSVEPAGGASYRMSASDTVDGGADSGSDSDGSDKGVGDSDASDKGSDSDGSDADGTDS
jgi:hypothetical protein